MDPQLQQIIELQTEQNQLLKRNLWRFRFSLLTLLILTTAICCGLLIAIYRQEPQLSVIRVPVAVPSNPLPVAPQYGSAVPAAAGVVMPRPNGQPNYPSAH
jgi:hypothetical protein